MEDMLVITQEKLETQIELTRFACIAPSIIRMHLLEHARETCAGKSMHERTNRFKVLQGLNQDEKLVVAQAIMFQTLKNMILYDEEVFDEYLDILNREAIERHS